MKYSIAQILRLVMTIFFFSAFLFFLTFLIDMLNGRNYGLKQELLFKADTTTGSITLMAILVLISFIGAFGYMFFFILNMKSKEEVIEPIIESPTGFSPYKYIVLEEKQNKSIFWTRGGEYRTDWYNLLFETDDAKEAEEFWNDKYYE